MSDRWSPLLGSLVVVTAASFFGMLGVLFRSVYELGLTPLAFVTWRAGIGALVIGVVVVVAVSRGGRLVGWRSLDHALRAPGRGGARGDPSARGGGPGPGPRRVAILSAAILIQWARPAEPALLPAAEPELSLEAVMDPASGLQPGATR